MTIQSKYPILSLQEKVNLFHNTPSLSSLSSHFGNLIVAQPVKIFPTLPCSQNPQLICILREMNPVQPSCPISSRSILTLLHPRVSFQFLQFKFCTYFSATSCVPMPHSSHLPWLVRRNNLWTVQITKLLIKQFSSASSYSLLGPCILLSSLSLSTSALAHFITFLNVLPWLI